MKARGRAARIEAPFTGGILALIYLAALLFAPFRLGRLLRTVSIPRLREHSARTALTVFGVALGVAVLIAVVLVNRSILSSLAATFSEVGGRADLQVSGGSAGFDESLFDVVRTVPGVWKATPTLQQTAVLRDPRARGEHILLLGVDLLGPDDSYFRSYVSEQLPAITADPLAFLNSSHNIIITRSLAQRFGYRLHDQISIATPHGLERFEIWGFIEHTGVGRAFGGAFGVMYHQAMQVAFERGHNIDGVDIAVAPGSDPETVARAVRQHLGSGFTVERPEHKNDRVAKMLLGMRTGLSMGSMIALLVGMFLIHNTMSISVVQRKREIGILRALGTPRRDVLALLTLEGLLLGTVGAALGVVLGIGLAHVMLQSVTRSVSDIYVQMSVTSLELDRRLIGLGFALGIVTTTLASALPARRASRMNPVEILRGGAMSSGAPTRTGITRLDLAACALIASSPLLLRMRLLFGIPLGPLLACAALLLAGAFLTPRVVQALHVLLTALAGRWLGVEAQLANDNLPRDLARSATTAAALMLGVAMATSFAVFVGSFVASAVEWIEQSIPADLFVTSAARFGGHTNAPMADGLQREFATIPDVEAVERVRVVDSQYRGVPVALVSTDISVFGKYSHVMMLEGTQREALTRVRNGAVMISENFARRFDVHVGSRIALSGKDGMHQFEVAGVDVDYTNDRGTIVLEREVYMRFFGDTRVDTYKVYVRHGAQPQTVRRAINRRFGEAYDLFVLTNREFKAASLRLINQVFSVIDALKLVALMIAVLGVVNALFASVLDRTREIAVLRAVGMLRRQARKMVLLEGALIGVVGAVSGLIVGSLLGELLLSDVNLTETGWYFPYRPAWGSMTEIAAAVVVASALAAFYPAGRAAALIVSEALEYE